MVASVVSFAGKPAHVFFPDAWVLLAERVRSVSTFRVLLALPGYLSWTEYRPLVQRELAERLGISGASVSRAMNELLDLKMVERIGSGPVMRWKLSLILGWRGSPAAYRYAVRKARQSGVVGSV